MTELKKQSRKSASANETMSFQIKRHHFYAALLPVAFLLGIAAGFVFWGQEVNVPPAQAIDSPAAIVQETGQASGVTDLASQMESLPRYDVPISEDDPTLGPADAPVTIVEFSDFQCPFCQRHAQETYPMLLQEYGDQIRFVYKDFPLSSIHPEAYSAAIAGTCAFEQENFWEYHDLLFSGRLELGRETYITYAEELGLDLDAFSICFDEARYAEAVQADFNLAQELGVSSTPTFLINGIALIGAQPFSSFATIIDYELANPSN